MLVADIVGLDGEARSRRERHLRAAAIDHHRHGLAGAKLDDAGDVLEPLDSRSVDLEHPVALPQPRFLGGRARLNAADHGGREGLARAHEEHQEQQNLQLKSLVKIYESMKPKDAAQIFEELDMTILVEILANMKEAKSAPILAAMDPKRVKEVTARLINRRTLGPTAENQGEKSAVRR